MIPHDQINEINNHVFSESDKEVHSQKRRTGQWHLHLLEGRNTVELASLKSLSPFSVFLHLREQWLGGHMEGITGTWLPN